MRYKDIEPGWNGCRDAIDLLSVDFKESSHVADIYFGEILICKVKCRYADDASKVVADALRPLIKQAALTSDDVSLLHNDQEQPWLWLDEDGNDYYA